MDGQCAVSYSPKLLRAVSASLKLIIVFSSQYTLVLKLSQ